MQNDFFLVQTGPHHTFSSNYLGFRPPLRTNVRFWGWHDGIRLSGKFVLRQW
jgi:hypothetical protein